MKIAIHKSTHSFSSRWISYCDEKGIDYKIVNCYANDILEQIQDCDALFWHFYHANQKDALFAKSLLNAVALSGKFVFPDFHSSWHFDDKVAQKYLLESVHAPLVPTHVFYSKQEALKWIEGTSFPKVFKLRTGAGSQNVILVKSASHARSLVKKAFGKGFSPYSAWAVLKDRIQKYKQGKDSVSGVLKAFARLFISTPYARMQGREKGYAYFQDFIPNNDSDIRVVVIGKKAFAIKRLVRENDFRASGSGHILYDKKFFDSHIISLSFDLAQRLKTKCIAFDYVFMNNTPLVVEVSYGFSAAGYDQCPGYWDDMLLWHEGAFNPQGWMIDLALENSLQRA